MFVSPKVEAFGAWKALENVYFLGGNLMKDFCLLCDMIYKCARSDRPEIKINSSRH